MGLVPGVVPGALRRVHAGTQPYDSDWAWAGHSGGLGETTGSTAENSLRVESKMSASAVREVTCSGYGLDSARSSGRCALGGLCIQPSSAIRGPNQGTGQHSGEAEAYGELLVLDELLGLDPALDRVVAQ